MEIRVKRSGQWSIAEPVLGTTSGTPKMHSYGIAYQDLALTPDARPPGCGQRSCTLIPGTHVPTPGPATLDREREFALWPEERSTEGPSNVAIGQTFVISPPQPASAGVAREPP